MPIGTAMPIAQAIHSGLSEITRLNVTYPTFYTLVIEISVCRRIPIIILFRTKPSSHFLYFLSIRRRCTSCSQPLINSFACLRFLRLSQLLRACV